MRTLIIDNYDSFTFNLFQLIATINGEEPLVVRNDQLTWEELQHQPYDNIVISPGPGTPERDADFGICKQALQSAQVPTLGVCLGHQGMGFIYGAEVSHAPEPMHGRLSAVYHDDSELWQGIPQGFKVVRYHSLMLENRLQDPLRRTAWTEDGILMGMRHAELPLWGVQFHPESICTEYGDQLLKNFRDLTHKFGSKRSTVALSSGLSVVPCAPQATVEAHVPLSVQLRRLAITAEPDDIYATVTNGASHTFWLDSSRAEKGLSRFSFMGASGGPNSLFVSYNATTGQITETKGDSTRILHESIYTYLDRELRRRHFVNADLPFDFNGGFVGYFGYELKVEAGATHRNPCRYPDAMFLLADRFVALDHTEGAFYLVSLCKPGEEADAKTWLDDMEQKIAHTRPSARSVTDHLEPITFELARTREEYLGDILRCQELIRDGETYEVCLTNRIHTSAVPDALALYKVLRHVNPAPYAAFLNFGDMVVLSSSPERFLNMDRDRNVETKPIKGTRPRGATAEEDSVIKADLACHEKDRSENLMIVDLLRNDLGIVCEVGSVHVPKLMDVETYETVHQLVSTVRGRLRPGLNAVDYVRHSFPGGSMTGAPKLRTMNIIDTLETEARGVYSGSIGFLAFNGTADLNIVIRTLVQTPSATTIGVGGAIVILSDPEAEFEETLVKARALIRAVLQSVRKSSDPEVCENVLAQLRATGRAVVS